MMNFKYILNLILKYEYPLTYINVTLDTLKSLDSLMENAGVVFVYITDEFIKHSCVRQIVSKVLFHSVEKAIVIPVYTKFRSNTNLYISGLSGIKGLDLTRLLNYRNIKHINNKQDLNVRMVNNVSDIVNKYVTL